MSDYPPPRELVRAYRTLQRLSSATFDADIRDMGGDSAWEGLVEGRRSLAVTTSYLGAFDERYATAWQHMMDSG